MLVIVLIVLVAAVEGEGTCDSNLVRTLQECANAINDGEALPVQIEKCSPDGCNYDCPSASKLEEQIKYLTEKLDTISDAVVNNTASISAVKDIVTNNTANIATNAANIANNSQNIAVNAANINKTQIEGHFACGSFGWTRLAYLDMSDPTQDCPTEFRLHSGNGVRGCGRQISSVPSCDSKLFSTNDMTYSEVCGRVLGYQYGSGDAIGSNSQGHNDINAYYADGISITRGSPREHVWTYMVGYSETLLNGNSCPCNNGISINVQSFVGTNYYCESGNPETGAAAKLYSDDVLWDGDDCSTNEVPCCQYSDLPWFHKVFYTATDEDIEMRICGDEHSDNEDSPVFLYEILIK